MYYCIYQLFYSFSFAAVASGVGNAIGWKRLQYIVDLTRQRERYRIYTSLWNEQVLRESELMGRLLSSLIVVVAYIHTNVLIYDDDDPRRIPHNTHVPLMLCSLCDTDNWT